MRNRIFTFDSHRCHGRRRRGIAVRYQPRCHYSKMVDADRLQAMNAGEGNIRPWGSERTLIDIVKTDSKGPMGADGKL